MIELIAIFLCLLCSAFFSGSETALTAVSRAQLYQLIKDGNKRAERAGKLRERQNELISTLLVGNTVVNIAGASIATMFAVGIWGEEWGALYATLAMTFLVTVFSEVLPKTVAINRAERISLMVAYPISWCVRIFSPVTRMMQIFIHLMLKPFGLNYNKGGALVSASDAIRGTIELHHSEGDVEKQDRDMLGSILDLHNREIGEIMLHRTHVYAIDLGADPEVIIRQAIDSVHSRIPIYRGNPDDIIGVLHVKDVLKLVTSQKIGITREMIRRISTKPWFVPETTPLDNQLYAFRSRRQHFACVVDEYGDFLGIVTLEDIIEEIVGEIDDEHDRLEVSNIIPFGTNAWRVEGSVTIRDLNRYLDWELPDDNATTVAGLVLHEAEMIPEQGAIFEFYNTRFTIAERKGNQLTQLVVEPLAGDSDGDDEW